MVHGSLQCTYFSSSGQRNARSEIGLLAEYVMRALLCKRLPLSRSAHEKFSGKISKIVDATADAVEKIPSSTSIALQASRRS